MKIHLNKILILIFLLISSCNGKKVNELNNKIEKLKKLNTILNDSIITMNYRKISNSITMGIRFDSILKVGKKEKVKFIFHYPEELISYDIYTTDSVGSPDKLIIADLNKNEFEYEFIPTKSGSEMVELVAVFNIKNQLYNEVIEIPIITEFATTE